MTNILRTIEFLALSVWVGSIVLLSFVVAPAAFSVATRDQAGAVVGLVLARMHWMGVGAGCAFLLARMMRMRSVAALAAPAALAVILMVALALVSQVGVSRRMARLRAEMGSIEKTPVESPLRVEFNSLHKWSVRLEGAVLVAGIAAIALLVREGSS
jgi:uncharacterized membrane protein